ncbi:MAG: homogentisate 1,2-dioxygenase [Fimbriimonadaceae bacterium]|nr:homogentisate 1,2-dioxygenase [Fimbriimonadaceae bacterium]
MIRYHRLGDLPAKKHVQFRQPDGSLYAEQLFSTIGFDGPMTTLYHRNLPTEVAGWEDLGPAAPTYLADEPLRHRHLKTARMTPRGDCVTGRVPLMGNRDCVWNQALVAENQPDTTFFKNAEADEIYFLHDGTGRLDSMYGSLAVRPGDYVVIPRGTIYRFHFETFPVRAVVLESHGPVTTPRRYRNEYGQMLEHAPYSERDFRAPDSLVPHTDEGDYAVVVKARGRHTRYRYRFHPLDVVGWDGFVYPVAFSIHDFQPITGQLHLPPPIHQTFATPNFVVCSFCPRMLDYHPDAIVIPYNHSNVDSDEILYYCNDKFGSRKGIEEGSITMHPLGIPHGPQPGAVEASIGATRTNELAVMMDTFKPLALTAEALALEDPDYWKSWQTRA